MKRDRMKGTVLKMMSVFLALILVASPIFAVSSTAADVQEETYSDYDGGLTPWDVVNQAIAAPFIPWMVAYDTIAGGYHSIVNSILGANGSATQISDPTTVDDYAKAVKSMSLINGINVVSALSTKLVSNDRETWALTESYINRLAEISASSLWSSSAGDTISNHNAVLINAGIYQIITKGNGNTQSALDWGAYQTTDNLIRMWNDGNVYRDISAGFAWRGHTGDYRTNQHMMLDFATISQVTTVGRNIVYLDLDYHTNINIETGQSNSAGMIYCNGNGQIRPLNFGSSWIPVNGSLSLDTLVSNGFQSGWYELQVGYTYAGPFYPSMNGDSAPCTGGAVLIFGDDMGFITVRNGNIYISYNNTADTRMDYLRVIYRYNDVDYCTGGSEDEHDYYSRDAQYDTILKEELIAYSLYYTQLIDRIVSASNAADLIWTISTQTRSSNIFLSPTSVIPQVRELGYDSDMAYVLYRVALCETAKWYETYGEVLEDNQVTLSEESLKLTFSGAVYDYSGALLSVGDTSFIPIVYLKDYVLTEGRNEFQNEAGILVGVQTGSIYHMPSGCYFTVDDEGIVFDGYTVQSVTLHVKGVEEIGIHDLLKPSSPSVPKTYDGDFLFMILIVELGAIIGLAGLLVRNPIGILIGVIVAVLGIVFSSGIANIVLGWLG